jgi:hypothetical protein
MTAVYVDCWCGCPANRHKLEPVKGQLRHTGCNRCRRCEQYDARISEQAAADRGA